MPNELELSILRGRSIEPYLDELSQFWTRLGYVEQPEMRARFKWREVGFPEERENSLTFWIKEL